MVDAHVLDVDPALPDVPEQPAELARVLGLGARVVEQYDDWAVLADPGGMLFCVVPVQTGDDFDAYATTWP